MCRKNPKQIYKSLYYTAPAVEVARVRVSQGVFVHVLVFMPLTAQSEKGRLQVQRFFFFGINIGHKAGTRVKGQTEK